jgi:hypothetical protein
VACVSAAALDLGVLGLLHRLQLLVRRQLAALGTTIVFTSTLTSWKSSIGTS